MRPLLPSAEASSDSLSSHGLAAFRGPRIKPETTGSVNNLFPDDQRPPRAKGCCARLGIAWPVKIRSKCFITDSVSISHRQVNRAVIGLWQVPMCGFLLIQCNAERAMRMASVRQPSPFGGNPATLQQGTFGEHKAPPVVGSLALGSCRLN